MPKPSHQEPKISRLPPPAGPEKVVVLNPDEYKQDQTMLTVILHEEDHTVGNALKHVICQMKGVEFCGYNVPHPLEDKILIRIQTEKGVSAGDILLQGLVDLSTIFDEIQKKFTTAHSDFIQGKEERRVEGTSHEADSFEVE